MPLIASPVIAPPKPPPAPPPVVGLPDVGVATVTYTDPTGKVWPLSDSSAGWFTRGAGVSGLGAVVYTHTRDAQPRGGALLRHVAAQPRSIVWPLYVYGRDHMEFVGRWRALATAFTRTLRPGPDGRPVPGVLTVARPDGTARRIHVFYDSGFEGQPKRGAGVVSDNAVITFWCEDPYWQDTVPVTVRRESAVPLDHQAPYPTISSGQVLGATTLDVPGDVVVWPLWRITGPATLITVTREDTGEAFTIDPAKVGHGALAAGEQVTVRTDPPQVRGPDGSTWSAALDWPGAVLWPLAPGTNEVTFQLDGAGPGSAVDLEFHPRYETA
ncbi:serine/arginine repetitive matrix protein 2 [Streptomyces laurentii]|uniref:Serine/arginine repetitive matrix protein 2 n=1 Tax=Streptomyces laurentii TaxID=39478 RepID=A0A160NYT0_STRLU|nr:serine/arginine repetitive matrix protein 2 [Streptomyces laurentii]